MDCFELTCIPYSPRMISFSQGSRVGRPHFVEVRVDNPSRDSSNFDRKFDAEILQHGNLRVPHPPCHCPATNKTLLRDY